MVCNPPQKWQSLMNAIKSIKMKILKKLKNLPDGPYQLTYVPNLVQIGTYLGKETIPLLFLLQNHKLTNSKTFFSLVIS